MITGDQLHLTIMGEMITESVVDHIRAEPDLRHTSEYQAWCLKASEVLLATADRQLTIELLDEYNAVATAFHEAKFVS